MSGLPHPFDVNYANTGCTLLNFFQSYYPTQINTYTSIYTYTHIQGFLLATVLQEWNENAHIFFCIWFFSTSTLYRNLSESTGKPLIILFHGCILSHDVGITIYSAIPLLLDHLFISRLFSFWEEGQAH